MIVGDPDGLSTDTLRSGAEVVVPAHFDGHAPGLERVQDLGIGAVTFPASGNAEDLALLLADTHGADLVVTVGFQATLHEFLDRGRSGSNPSTFLTRLKLGSKVVDGKAVATLHRSRVSVGAVVAARARRAHRGAGRARRLRCRRRLRRLARQHLARIHELGWGSLLVISLRYHVISIAAVFLALAVGVVLGSTTLSRTLLSGLNNENEDLVEQVNHLENDKNAQAARLADADSFAAVRRPDGRAGAARATHRRHRHHRRRAARRPRRAQDARRERGRHGHRRAAAHRVVQRPAQGRPAQGHRRAAAAGRRPAARPRPTPARSRAACSARFC